MILLREDLFRRTRICLFVCFLTAMAPVWVWAVDKLEWQFAYDNKDRLIRSIDPAGRGTNLVYDYHDNGRLRSLMKKYPSGGDARYEFDRFGRMTSMQDSTGKTQYSYDGYDRLTKVQHSGMPEIGFEYDTSARITKIQVGDKLSVGYEFDFLGRLAAVKTPAGNIQYKYWPAQGTMERVLPNGVWTRYEYQPDGKLKTITHVGKDNLILAKFEYSYRPDGLVSSVEETCQEGRKRTSYEYDKVCRLVQANVGDKSFKYDYDKIGNLVSYSSPDRTASGSYDWAGRILRYGEEEFTHDAAGNLTERRATSGSAVKYSYNDENQLTSVKTPDSTVQYRYDGEGNLVEQIADGKVTRFISMPFAQAWQPIVAIEPNGRLRLFIWGENLLGSVVDGAATFYLADRIGSICLETDGGANISGQPAYAVFGNPVAPGKEGIKPGFGSLFFDSSSGLYLTRGRGYDPVLGRFLQRDPDLFRSFVLTQNDLSPYLYCRGDPVNFVDVTGNAPEASVPDIFESKLAFYRARRSQEPSALLRLRDSALIWGWATGGKLSQLASGFQQYLDWAMSQRGPLSNIHTWNTYAAGIGAPFTYAGAHFVSGRLGLGPTLDAQSTLVGKMFATGASAVDSLVGKIASKAGGYVSAWSSNLGEIQRADSLWGIRNLETAISLAAVSDRLAGITAFIKNLGSDTIAKGAELITLSRQFISRLDLSFQGVTQAISGLFVVRLEDPSGPAATPEDPTSPVRGEDPKAPTKRKPAPSGPVARGHDPSDPVPVEYPIGPVVYREDPFDPVVRVRHLHTRVVHIRYLSRPGRIGGVSLSGAGKALQGLGKLSGIALDKENGRLVLLGAEQDKKIGLSPLRLDDVVTVFRSVYDHGMAPFVSIDPKPDDPHGPVMLTRFGPEMENTYPGWILFETDRIMKTYGMGQDNITQRALQCKVPGYKDVLDARFDLGGKGSENKEGSVWERFWIVPAQVTRSSSQNDNLTLFDVPLKVNTERMELEKGKLVTAKDPKPTEGAHAFAEWFTANYAKIAEEAKLGAPDAVGKDGDSRIYLELQKIALITAIAEQLRDQGIPMPQWMRDREIKKCPTPVETPAITAKKSRSETTKAERNTTVTRTYTSRIYGGVQLAPADNVVRPVSQDPRTARIAAAVKEALPADPQPRSLEIKSEAGKYNAATIPGSDTVDVGALDLARLDLRVPMADEIALDLARYYNSFCDPVGDIGRGWTLNLPRLISQPIPTKRTDSKSEYAGGFVLLDSMGDLNTPLFEIKSVAAGQGKTVTPKYPQGIVMLAKSDETRAKGAERQVIFSDGKRWHFNAKGYLVAINDGPLTIVYERDGALVRRIEGWNGQKMGAEISLEHDAQGRMVKAVASNGKEARYSYDDKSRLIAVQGLTGEEKYGYKETLLTSITANGDPVTLVYDDCGRVLKTLDAKGQPVAVREIFRDANGTRIVTKHKNKAGSYDTNETTYDRRFRPVKETYSDGSDIAWQYAQDGSEATASYRTPEKDEYRIKVDGKGKELVVQGPQGGQYSLKEKSAAQTELWLGQKRAGSVSALQDGKIKSLETENSELHIEYGQDRSVSRMLLTPPGPGPSFDHWLEIKLNAESRLAQAKDYTGDSVEIDYDPKGQPKRIQSKQGWVQTERDSKNRPVNISRSWGTSDTFGYDEGAKIAEHKRLAPGGSPIVTKFGPNGLLEFANFDGGVTKYSYYDTGAAHGRPKGVHTANDLAISYEYDDKGRLSSVKVGGQYALAYRYDEKGRLTSLAMTQLN